MNAAHSGVTKPPVNRFDLEPFPRLEEQLDEYESLHHKVAPPERGRGFVTPKLRIFCTIVHECCEATGKNYYYVNEQAGEAIHVVSEREETHVRKCKVWLVDKEAPSVKKRKTRGAWSSFRHSLRWTKTTS